ncbi:DUF983 domain-containing protein [Roseomonas gilardii]|uniref:DUF983 domain-containing protein n=1 Tax=Roseomonas gilardii TaxID=257708 RepID=UPI0021B63691|nr:DUF983 domain-containing protein [Roseomonas gilardii]
MTQISHAGGEALTDHRPAAPVADAPVVRALAHPVDQDAFPGARWSPRQGPPDSPAGAPVLPSLLTAMGRGLRNRCPVCGEGRVFQGFLAVAPACEHCGTPLGRIHADDAPPYFTIFIVGHLLLPPVFWVEKAYQPPMWFHMALWLPLFALVTTLLLRPVKGATVGLMLKLGFGGAEDIPLENQDHIRGGRHDV